MHPLGTRGFLGERGVRLPPLPPRPYRWRRFRVELRPRADRIRPLQCRGDALMLPARVPPPSPGPVTLSKLLLVEGDTPMHFFEALLKELGLQDDIEIRNFRGVGDFKTYLVNLADTDEFKRVVTSVGVIRDAEAKPATAARAAIEYALTAAGLTPTRTPLVRTSIFILPDNTNEG